jgi:hypothetical protein
VTRPSGADTKKRHPIDLTDREWARAFLVIPAARRLSKDYEATTHSSEPFAKRARSDRLARSIGQETGFLDSLSAEQETGNHRVADGTARNHRHYYRSR